MISKSPRLFMNTQTDIQFAKFQPSKSVVFDKLATIRDMKKEYESSSEPNSVGVGFRTGGSTSK